MKKALQMLYWLAKIAVGCVVFALGFDLFLAPHDLNAGGISGLAQIIVHILGFGSVGAATMLMNLPLFAVGGLRIGKKFFVGSLVGMIVSSLALDLLTRIPVPATEPLPACFISFLPVLSWWLHSSSPRRPARSPRQS